MRQNSYIFMKEIQKRFKFISSKRNYIETRYYLNYSITIKILNGLKHITLSKYGFDNDMCVIWYM